MKARAGIGISIVIAFFTALTIASSPRLHEKLHKVGTHHECAATMIASGNCEHSCAASACSQTRECAEFAGFSPETFSICCRVGSFFGPGTRPARCALARSPPPFPRGIDFLAQTIAALFCACVPYSPQSVGQRRDRTPSNSNHENS